MDERKSKVSRLVIGIRCVASIVCLAPQQVQNLVKRAELIQHSENPQRHRLALEMLLEARRDMDAICAEITDIITEHDAKGELLKQANKKATEGAPSEVTGNKSGKNREDSIAPSEDPAEDDLPKTPAGMEHRHKRNALHARLRETHIVLHHIHFRLGDMYHILGDTHKGREAEAYEMAEKLRKRLLKSTFIGSPRIDCCLHPCHSD